ncbi:RDD family protein [Granulosicoccus antarcticus]
MFTGDKSNIRSKRREVHAARRAMAFGIDIALLFMLMFALMVMGMQNSISNMTFSFIALYWLVGIPVLEASKWQASVGKRLFGLIVVNGNNERIGFGRSFGRCYLSYLSLVIIQLSVFANAYAWFRYNALIHDTLSKSYVSRHRR